MKEYVSDQSLILVADLSYMNRRIFDLPVVNESLRDKIKRIVSKIWTAAPILYFSTRGTAIQILKAIPIFISRRFIYERSDCNIRDWSLAYFFIYEQIMQVIWEILLLI